MPQDYNATLNLPKTEFPMRAGLPKSEPETLKRWEQEKIYEKLMEKNEGKPLFVLHDGPPYANGNIHLGTSLNKVLKDIIVRYKNMSGFKSPYVPGWDTHGLPTELKARAKAGVENSTTISELEIRKICREFALGYLDDQRNQFKRLGVIGEWDNPYITLLPEFEAKQIEIFAEMACKGYIYKGLKPVYWCPDCKTALAEAEIEYAEDPCHSIYVKFKVNDDQGKLKALGIEPEKCYFVIWTTTTWTLPGNVAICLGPDFDYSIIKCGDEYYIMAEALAADAMKEAGKEDYEVVGTMKGIEFEYMKAQHPFLDRESLVIVGDHVTLESGTGCVHTAPGHGVEDYDVCKNYPEIPIVVPVDADGRLTEEAGQFAGLLTGDANKPIAQHLDSIGALFALKKIIHQYPHCWRCKNPVLFRATDQWFCSVEDFKDEAVKAINEVEWIPGWGKDRITSMVKERKDWCISRQRKWGVPIPIFFCKDCGEPYIDRDAMMAVADLFRKEGSDAWFKYDASEILPEGTKCPKCGGTHFNKEQDIMDVWFDSGSSHAAVLEQRDYLKWPADLYLEGADQYRGWFQSSLLTSVATKGTAPYKAVLTHGWVVDGEGRKMSKSLGNGIDPQEIVEQYGADVLRLWVASSDYHADIRISKDILKQLSEAYRKIRNTARYILGNLNDFNPDTDMVDVEDLYPIDKWAIAKLNELNDKVRAGYDAYEFHQVYHSIHNFCVVDMSNFYLDVLKDRLYTEKADSASRRAAQTTIYMILDAMTRMISPILAYTSDEIWRYMPHGSNCDKECVLFNEMPAKVDVDIDAEFMARWDRIHELRDLVKKSIEVAVKNKLIKSSLESKIVLTCGGDNYEFVNSVLGELTAVFIVSKVELVKGDSDEINVVVEKAEGEKCERCWVYSDTVGQNSEHPTLCARCAEILK
ncbi:isoleucine--tRNA ligase [Anaeromassilibacillus sp. An172]|uniref:isoleucine--tRNA ligase n=1 Tax=Anaeromassilibacillus sp. An172 TaxID=1965570 RepID=UPI000B38E851|nr:isoleucine--tRNA ligase [Anaeromassilibacillus sp. An172]MEE0763175.1 isoleucine--tRNA ligase [Acutalibacteraceae bacterium]OUP79588.1 isoleucine--tRNA ligase [Anaeromassilibacillus sp. An172]